MINEMAPRPHNSGHYTIDACITSQYEQQVRALCGLPLGEARAHSAAVMVNLLGDLWYETGATGHATASRTGRSCTPFPACKLHLYGKHHARPGRKMGHFTVIVDDDPERARQLALAARAAIGICDAP
jgi:5-(carboxyamino)imidazole ribonucleotide synthase